LSDLSLLFFLSLCKWPPHVIPNLAAPNPHHGRTVPNLQAPPCYHFGAALLPFRRRPSTRSGAARSVRSRSHSSCAATSPPALPRPEPDCAAPTPAPPRRELACAAQSPARPPRAWPSGVRLRAPSPELAAVAELADARGHGGAHRSRSRRSSLLDGRSRSWPRRAWPELAAGLAGVGRTWPRRVLAASWSKLEKTRNK
jgi:hypothetical protein